MKFLAFLILTKQFDIVSGNDIAYWYNDDNYSSGGGTLNSSCMSCVNPSYFDIYCNNDNVSLVILYDDNGEMDLRGYKSDLIKGRALLWTCEIDGEKAKFMDRIYTKLGSDIELFKEFAEKNGWWYKESQTMEPLESITNGSLIKNATIVARLDDVDHEYYPYMDTMCYISVGLGIVTNNDEYRGISRVARDTDGEYEHGEYSDEYSDE